jgi:hypothetical protein
MARWVTAACQTAGGSRRVRQVRQPVGRLATVYETGEVGDDEVSLYGEYMFIAGRSLAQAEARHAENTD